MAQFDSMLALVKAGGTYGAVPTFAAGDALICSAIEITPLEGDILERTQADGESGRVASRAMVRQRSSATLTFEAAGSGVAGTRPKWSALAEACGGTWADVATVSNTLTEASLNSSLGFADIRILRGGFADYRSHGARGNMVITLPSGELPTIQATMMGLYTTPVAQALITPTYSNQARSVVVDSVNTPTVQIGPTGTPISRCISNFSLDFGCSTTYYNEAGCTSPEVRITARQPTATITFRETSLADFNIFDFSANQSPPIHGFKIVHGPAGARMTIEIPKLTYGQPSHENRDGLLYTTVELYPERVAGNPSFFSCKAD
jgi:hypothetical protein